MKYLRNYYYLMLLPLLMTALYLSYTNRAFKNRMGAFTTSLSARSVDQKHNILRLTHLIDGIVLKPGERFSFNNWLGPDLAKYDLTPERVIIEGHVTSEVGGGICQLVSTLYNAALIAGLQIESRVAHSRNVSSVPSSLDATVKWGTPDLVLSNPYTYPIKISAKQRADQLIVAINGTGQAKFSLARSMDSSGVSKLS